MRKLAWAMMGGLLLAAAGFVSPAVGGGAPERQEAVRVIRAQLAAFAQDDADAAFLIASDAIRARFGNAQNFLTMVRATYPQVYRAQAVEFLEGMELDGRWVQKVYVIGPDGRGRLAIYQVTRETKGGYRIDGCYLTDAPFQPI